MVSVFTGKFTHFSSVRKIQEIPWPVPAGNLHVHEARYQQIRMRLEKHLLSLSGLRCQQIETMSTLEIPS